MTILLLIYNVSGGPTAIIHYPSFETCHVARDTINTERVSIRAICIKGY